MFLKLSEEIQKTPQVEKIHKNVDHDQSINQSINQDISNAPANKISHWHARQRMDEIKRK